MAVKVDITANVSQIRDAINQVQSEILELKVNGSEVTIGGKKIKAEVKEVTNEVKNLNREIKNTNANTQQTVNNATKLMGRLGTQAKQAGGYIKDIATSLITPWTAIIIAVEAAAKTFTYFFNNLTENIDKLTARGNSTIKDAQRNIKLSEQRTKKSVQLIKKLEELNKVEQLSFEQQAYGDSIVQRLNNQYKGLGLTVTDTAERYQGLYKALKLVEEQNKRVRKGGLNQEIRGQRDVVNAVMKEVFGSGLELGKPIDGKDLFTIAERMGGTFGAENADLLAKKWGNGTNLKNMREVFAQLMGGLSDRSNVAEVQKVIDAFDTLIDYTNELKQLNSASQEVDDTLGRLTTSFQGQRDAIKSTKDAIKELQDQYNKFETKEAFTALTPEEQVKDLKKQVEELKAANDELQKEQDKNKQAQTKIAANNFDAPINLEWAGDKIKKYEKAVNESQKKLSELKSTRDQYEKAIKDWEDKISKPTANGEEPTKLQSQALHNIDKVKADVAEAEKELKSNQTILKTLREQFALAEKAYQSSEADILSYEQKIDDNQKEQLKNKLAIQEKTKQIADLEQKIAEAQIKANEEARKASEALWAKEDNAKKSIQDQIFSIENDLLRKQGQEREAILRENIKKIEQQLGRPLQEMDQNYLKAAESMTDIQMAMKGLNETQPQLQSDKVYSNELARMGGFSSSIVVDRMDINKEILNTNKSSNQYLNTINSGIQEVNKNLQW